MTTSSVSAELPSLSVARKLDSRTGQITTYFSPPDFVPVRQWPPQNKKEWALVTRAYVASLMDRTSRSNWNWFLGLAVKAKAESLHLQAEGVVKTPEGIYQFKESA